MVDKQKGEKKRQENPHEKRGGSFGEPVGEGDLDHSFLSPVLSLPRWKAGLCGLGARADLRSCSEWYTDKPLERSTALKKTTENSPETAAPTRKTTDLTKEKSGKSLAARTENF